MRVNVVESAKFRAIFLALKPIAPKLLHELQHSLLFWAKDGENVVVSAAFITQHPRGRPELEAELGLAGQKRSVADAVRCAALQERDDCLAGNLRCHDGMRRAAEVAARFALDAMPGKQNEHRRQVRYMA